MKQLKGKKTFLALSIIFTFIAVCLFAICFSLALHIFLHYDEYKNPNNNSGIGFSFAGSIVLYLIFGLIDIPVLTLGGIFSILAIKKNSKKCLIPIITNILNFIVLVIIFVIIYFMLQ